MNYYQPNFYSNYPYNQYQQSSMMQQQQQQFAPQVQMGLQGKIVDGEDVVKATDVPVGGYGVFPKADLSEVYIKTWNPNGTTSVTTFKPVIPQEKVKQEDINNLLLNKMQQLEDKLDAILKPVQAAVTEQQQPAAAAQTATNTAIRREF